MEGMEDGPRLRRSSTNECLFPAMQEIAQEYSLPSFVQHKELGQNSYNRAPSTLHISRFESASSSPGVSTSLPSWKSEEVFTWLVELGLPEYRELFEEHALTSGNILQHLTDAHLKEIGITVVGHRIAILAALDELKNDKVTGNVESLLKQIELEKSKHILKCYPHRIILIRHGESQGNVDSMCYKDKPDNQLALTELGQKQADDAGKKLKILIGEETVSFYISPFVRSRQTHKGIRNSFPDEQVVYEREDPRIREQEWGNFQNPELMPQIMKDRRKVGAFYYRFATGESGADVYDRVSMFLESLYRDMERGICGNNIIIVSHGLFCRLFLTRFYYWKIEHFHRLWNFNNCQHAVMELQDNGHYRLISQLKSD